jgi:hypothetical protein
MDKIATRLTAILLSLALLQGSANAQADRYFCGFDDLVKDLAEKHEAYGDAFRHSFYEAQLLGESQTSAERSIVLTIPVVFHVVWNTNRPAENLADEVVLDQLAVLNEDYRRLNSDAGNIRPEFADIAGDAMIQFELAEIIRVETTANYNNLVDLADTDRVKRSSQGGSDAWDTDNYLNIWICKLPGNLLGQLLGYAYPPAGLPNWPPLSSAPSPEVDGVVVDYRTVGRNNPNPLGTSYVAVGRTAVHEVGHYLGLRHVWGDPIPIFQNGCQVDDGVQDTPNAKDPSSSTSQVCGATRMSCNSLDMWENYMDYAEEPCQVAFTEGQIAIMRGVLEGPRGDLPSIPLAVNLSESKEFKVYPNPVYNGFARFYASEVPNSLEVYDVVGKRVYFNDAIVNGQEIDLTNMQKGIYLITAEFDNGKATQKILIK